MDLHFPPTTFLAEDNATPIGINPDVARLVAKKLGLKLTFENTSFDTIIPGIDGGRFDFTVATMAPTPERLKVLDMIDYFNGGISVVVPLGNPLNLGNDTLCGRNIAVTKGSTAQLKHLPNVSNWTCTEKGKPAINAVMLPKVDTRSDNVAAIGLKKGSPLTPALQRAVQSVLDSPEYKESLANWGLEDSAITEAQLN
jgi:polar amino acid transport system substrate-binding protein